MSLKLCGKDPARGSCQAAHPENGGVPRSSGAAALVRWEAGQVCGGESLFRGPGWALSSEGKGASLGSITAQIGLKLVFRIPGGLLKMQIPGPRSQRTYSRSGLERQGQALTSPTGASDVT